MLSVLWGACCPHCRVDKIDGPFMGTAASHSELGFRDTVLRASLCPATNPNQPSQAFATSVSRPTDTAGCLLIFIALFSQAKLDTGDPQIPCSSVFLPCCAFPHPQHIGMHNRAWHAGEGSNQEAWKPFLNESMETQSTEQCLIM